VSDRDDEAELLAAIAASPDDDQTRLVYADWLLARGDRRGELLMLDHLERTTPGGLTHPDQLASMLRLAAELGFPHLPDPDIALLAFEPIGRADHYRMFHGGHRYTLLGQLGELSLAIDDQRPIYAKHYALHTAWDDYTTNVVLTIAQQAIAADLPFDRVVFPDGTVISDHPDYRKGPFPMYFSAEVVEDFERDYLIRARDHARWYELYDRMMVGFSATSHR
jgi:uncharacterized protein (TIGR02996 family)